MSFYPDSTSMIRRAALKLAGKGKPVFPCKADKAPYYDEDTLKHGCLDATTDPRKISALWHKWPEANIGIPTGKTSGLLILDFDLHKPGAMTVEEFEKQYGELPQTATVRTGNGGTQYYFANPEGQEIRNSAGKLGPHVDVRGEGGYTLTPPSVTTGRYEWINRASVAPVPPTLLEALRTEHHKPSGPGRIGPTRAGRRQARAAAGSIPEGTRNVTLASIAGHLHDGTRDLAQLEADLQEVNADRCAPPLEGEEVKSIARSIHRLAPCTPEGRKNGPPNPEVVGILGDILTDWWRADCRGPAGRVTATFSSLTSCMR